MKTLEERFWSAVPLRPEVGCWEWRRSRKPFGYGQVREGDSKSPLLLAHRVSWELANGRRLLPGEVVRHKCDNPSCVRPEHLEIGTHADNVRDCINRGRARRTPMLGEMNHQSKITDATRDVIRHSPLSLSALAQRYGVTRQRIFQIKRDGKPVEVA